MKLVLDTNIYLASLLTQGLCYDLIKIVFDRKNDYEVYISRKIYAELYNKVTTKREMVSTNVLDWLIKELNQLKTNTVKKGQDVLIPSSKNILIPAEHPKAITPQIKQYKVIH